MPFVTIFTPTYNRAYTLPKLYDSLRSQTSSDFEWIIIDDGSTDNTENLVGGWIKENNKFEITYLIKKYPFPHFDGEKFVPEALIFNRIAADGYKFRWVNENFYICEYLSDVYTKNVDKNLIGNWQGYTLYIKELMKSKASAGEKIIPLLGYIYRFVLKGFKKK